MINYLKCREFQNLIFFKTKKMFNNKNRISRWYKSCKETYRYFQSQEQRDSNICIILFDLIKFLILGILITVGGAILLSCITIGVFGFIGFIFSPIWNYLVPESIRLSEIAARKDFGFNETELLPLYFILFGRYFVEGLISTFTIIFLILFIVGFYYTMKKCCQITSNWLDKFNDINLEIYNKNSM